MKKTKVFIALGAVVMAITGIFGTKPAKKFAAPAQIYAGGAYGVVLAVISSTSHLTTIAGSLKKAQFKTETGSAVTLRTSSAGLAKTIYFKP